MIPLVHYSSCRRGATPHTGVWCCTALPSVLLGHASVALQVAPWALNTELLAALHDASTASVKSHRLPCCCCCCCWVFLLVAPVVVV